MKHDPGFADSATFGLRRQIGSPALARQALDPLPGELPHEALRRPGQEAMGALCATLLTLVRRDGRDLTAEQLTAFMTVYLDSQVHTVSTMAELLHVSRPGVTRILDRLTEYDLVAREEDRKDRRRILIRRTAHGAQFLHELENIATGNFHRT